MWPSVGQHLSLRSVLHQCDKVSCPDEPTPLHAIGKRLLAVNFDAMRYQFLRECRWFGVEFMRCIRHRYPCTTERHERRERNDACRAAVKFHGRCLKEASFDPVRERIVFPAGRLLDLRQREPVFKDN